MRLTGQQDYLATKLHHLSSIRDGISNELKLLNSCIDELDADIKNEEIAKLIGQIRETADNASSLAPMLESLSSQLQAIMEAWLAIEKQLAGSSDDQ